ncbi:Ig-like domain-containing protein [Coprobacter tertius]|uniref:Ig-like domain-containing protein n=1 Tax=Coprobacter tertius TaxID=2944915 RepID=A0ABT1MIK1_9BACT|nr:Ig-like domain-containing protein [Coprobacter tertius]MCP9612440.1 Ig-like domain-containing protein [Coprobacter tertius]
MKIQNNDKWHKHIFKLLCFLTAGFITYSCANMARPTGGPRDTTPPVYLKSNPLPNQLNVTKNRIEIDFDEIVQIDKPNEKVIISPPQKEAPNVRASGKKVIVELQDSLLENTTYTIDFSDAIADNNEHNKLENFTLSFSTGPTIDTLQISGVLLNAQDLEPITGMLVGVHSDLDDTAFVKLPFDRIAASDGTGHFTIRNLAPGNYRIFALKDLNRDYRFDNATEDIAFEDIVISPSTELTVRPDTIWADSLVIDTIIMKDFVHFTPDNIILKAFNENFKSHYLNKYERQQQQKISIFFAAPNDSLPIIKGLNFNTDDWAVIERNATNDTIHYWIKDSLIYQLDTLTIEARYLRTDSNLQLEPYADTLNFIMKNVKKNIQNQDKKHHRGKKEEEVPKIDYVGMNPNAPGTLNIYQDLLFTYSEPIENIDKKGIHLYIKQDTLWIPDDKFTFTQDSLQIRNFRLYNKWKPGNEYKLNIDSMAGYTIYGKPTRAFEQTFKIKKTEEYSNFYITTQGVKDSAFVELLNSSDAPVRRSPVIDGGAEFIYVDPGTYYARLVIDKNNNGKFDTGNYKEKRQPDEVYYYPEKIILKANWDVEQEWNVFALPADKQKPREIVKNKSDKEKQQKRQNEEDDDTETDEHYYPGRDSDPYGQYPGQPYNGQGYRR